MNKVTRAALAASLAIAASGAFAANDSAPLTVTATVVGKCKLDTLTDMAINADPSSGADATGTTTVKFRCTKNLPYTFAVGAATNVGGTYTSGTTAGTGALTGTGGDIKYSIKWTNPATMTGAGFASGDTISIPLTGTVALADYESKAAGTYTANVDITVNY